MSKKKVIRAITNKPSMDDIVNLAGMQKEQNDLIQQLNEARFNLVKTVFTQVTGLEYSKELSHRLVLVVMQSPIHTKHEVSVVIDQITVGTLVTSLPVLDSPTLSSGRDNYNIKIEFIPNGSGVQTSE